MPNMAVTVAQNKCRVEYSDKDREACQFGAQAAYDYLVKDVAPRSRGVSASPILVAKMRQLAEAQCAKDWHSRAEQAACMHGIGMFVEGMQD
jgi:hypothetical protein